MSNISTVVEVVGVAHKKDGSELRGIGKKGEWVMYEVILENGTKLNVFGPVSVGDTVYNLEQDPQYHNWKGVVKKAGTSAPVDASQPTNAQILNAILDLHKLIQGKQSVAPMPRKVVDDVVAADFDGEPIDIADIPF